MIRSQSAGSVLITSGAQASKREWNMASSSAMVSTVPVFIARSHSAICETARPIPPTE